MLCDISAKWQEIGLALDIGNNYLQGIAGSNASMEIKLNSVLRKWMDINEEVTWRAIIDAVEGPIVKNKRVAREMREFLCLYNY